jgi:hypothetical protein
MKRRTVCLNAVVFLAVSGGAQVASAHLPIVGTLFGVRFISRRRAASSSSEHLT